MKRLFLALVMFFFLAGSASAEILTFEWNQVDTTNLKEWKLFWGDTSGGPYTELSTIPYDGSPGPVYSSPAEANVTGDQGTNVVKYFVLIACGDVPQASGTPEYLCSEDSNEVSHSFWIPAGMFSVPIEFKIISSP